MKANALDISGGIRGRVGLGGRGDDGRKDAHRDHHVEVDVKVE